MTTRACPILPLKQTALITTLLLAAFLRLYRISDLPPGDGYDPAWYGVDALQILDGRLPIYLPTNIGREVLFSYVVALTVAVFGVGPHAIHIAAALIGILTVPATYLVAEALFARQDKLLRTYGGVLSALTLTVSFWHQHWSRYGVRAILVPLLTTLTLWGVARVLSADTPSRQRRFAILTGICLGLSLYTYQSARVLPFLVLSVLLLSTMKTKSKSKPTVATSLIITAVAATIFAPMGSYLIRHPGQGNERIDQTWAVDPAYSLQESARAIWSEVLDALKVLAVEGDDEIIHNLPGRPAVCGFLLVLFGLGLLTAVRRIKRWPYWVLLIWLPAMSITVFLSNGGQPTKRALGALPAIAMLVALGALTPLQGLQHWRETKRSNLIRALAAGWCIILAGGFAHTAVATYRDYFLLWAQEPDLWTHFEGGRVAIGRYAGTLPQNERIYSSPEMPDHPSIVYNSSGRSDLKGYNGRLCTVFPALTVAPTTYIIVQHEDGQSLDLLRAVYPLGQEIPAGPDYYGQPYFTAYRVPLSAEAQIAPQVPVSADWDHVVRFLGYDTRSTTIAPGTSLDLILYTLALSPIPENYILFVHMMNADDIQNPATGNALWAQDDSEPCRGFYPTSTWGVGEIIRDTYTLHLPQDTPPGRYNLELGFYTWPDFQRLAVAPGTDNSDGTTFTFGEIAVEN